MVTFWDTSAVVPLLVHEPTSQAIRQLARSHQLLVWWGTTVECLSAIARREREGSLSPDAAQQTRQRLGVLRDHWAEVQPSEQVRANAERALRLHPLRAADALQLGAALRWASQAPNGHMFFSLDQRLLDAARREGFEIVQNTE